MPPDMRRQDRAARLATALSICGTPERPQRTFLRPIGRPCCASGRLVSVLAVGSGADEPGLVGVDHHLNPVAQAELLQNAGDVCLRRGVADEQPVADLWVG